MRMDKPHINNDFPTLKLLLLDIIQLYLHMLDCYFKVTIWGFSDDTFYLT